MTQPLETNVVHIGDSAEVLATFPDACIDLTVTSPPYDNLRTYNGFTFDFEAIARQLYRVTKPGGVVVWVVGDATVNGSETGTSFRQALYFMECGFNLHDTMIYECRKAPLTHNRYEQAFEYMFVLSRGNPKTFNGLEQPRKWEDNRKKKLVRINSDGSPDYGYAKQSKMVLRDNFWKINSGGGHSSSDSVTINHPAIFPEDLARDHILSWSKAGDIVLDCFAGSGTTLKEAKKLGRQYIGIELSPKYVNGIIIPRLNNTSEPLLIVEAA